MSLYQQPKVEVKIEVNEDQGSFYLSSDRMFASFNDRAELDAFLERCSKFLAKLHNPAWPNRAGFVFMLSSDFGDEGSSVNTMGIWPAAIGEEGADPIVVANDLGNDDVADAWSLMTRKWDTTGEIEDDPIDGSWEKFRPFFIARSQEVADSGEAA